MGFLFRDACIEAVFLSVGAIVDRIVAKYLKLWSSWILRNFILDLSFSVFRIEMGSARRRLRIGIATQRHSYQGFIQAPDGDSEYYDVEFSYDGPYPI